MERYRISTQLNMDYSHRSIDMRYETVAYLPMKPTYDYDEIIEMLPDNITKELVKDSRQIYVTVEASKKEIVEYLDMFFSIAKREVFRKNVLLEVDKSEIDNFSHYSIMPNTLEMGRDIVGDIIRPTCSKDACPVGARLSSPLRISTQKATKIGFYKLYRPWGQPCELLVSSQVKTLFESEGIKGLSYEPCIFTDNDIAKVRGCEPLYLARIKRKVYDHADEIMSQKYICRKHNMIYNFCLFGDTIYEDDVMGHDFIEICGVEVKEKTYEYHVHKMMVSRLVLEVLLKHKIRSLSAMCVYLNEKFLPVLLSSRNDSAKNADDEIYNCAESVRM